MLIIYYSLYNKFLKEFYKCSSVYISMHLFKIMIIVQNYIFLAKNMNFIYYYIGHNKLELSRD